MFCKNRRFTSLCNLIVGCLNLAEEKSLREIVSENLVRSIITYKVVPKGTQLDQLPDSLIHEILLKLPIKSIIQCKYVCKSWNRIILNPFFANVYLKVSTCNAIVVSQHRTYINHERDCDADPDDQFFNYIEVEKSGEVTRTSLNLEALGISKWKRSWKSIVGSCNGLLCVVETPYEEYSSFIYSQRIFNLDNPNQTVWVVNLLIGKYMELPKVHGANNVQVKVHGANNYQVVYGFGSTVGGPYKVIRVAMVSSYLTETQILSVGVDAEWRDRDVFSTCLRLFPHGHGVTMNGVLHWVGVEAFQNVIYAFDIEKETEQCIPIPGEVRLSPNEFSLVVWNKRLCLINNTDKVQIDIWTINEEVKHWSRDIILKAPIPRISEVIPIATMRNGDLLLSLPDQGSLISLDPVTKKRVKLEGSSDLESSYFLVGYAYV